MTTQQLTRNGLLRRGFAGAALGAAALTVPGAAQAFTVQDTGSAVGDIYRLQAAFHRAKSTQDIDLMMSLWASDAVLNMQGDPNSPYNGSDSIKTFFLGSGSFTHRRLSLVPSFKIQITVGRNGDHAWLYFECHDVGDYDLPTRAIAADLFLAGVVRETQGSWLFSEMTAGKSFPLSVDHYYYP
jgi:hypothetical protein